MARSRYGGRPSWRPVVGVVLPPGHKGQPVPRTRIGDLPLGIGRQRLGGMAPKLETAVLMRLLRNRTDAMSRVSFGSSTALTAQKTGLPKCLRKQTFTVLVGMSQRCHVWTAPCWQELSSRFAALVGAAMCSAY